MDFHGVDSQPMRASVSLPMGAPVAQPQAAIARARSVPVADAPIDLPRAPETVEVHEAQRSELLNRSVNVVLAAIALFVLSPVFLLVALAVRLSSPGPIIYRQIRVGVDRRRSRIPAVYDRRAADVGGRVFTMYKFRSMTLNAEQNGIVWAKKNDSRVTSVGKFLRLTRIDELPQLINVLIGDMNIVGPRPERPGIFVRLRNEIDDYQYRQRAKPGITGWAQVNQDYDSTIADVRRKVQYDLDYIRRQSLAEDIRIMLRTIPVMVLRRGAR